MTKKNKEQQNKQKSVLISEICGQAFLYRMMNDER
jgi:hypothetical protein